MSKNDDRNSDSEFTFVVDSIEIDSAGDIGDFVEGLDDESDEDDVDSGPVDTESPETDPVDLVGKALAPGAPLFLIHKGHFHGAVLPAVAADIARRHSGAVSIGTIASLPRSSSKSLTTYFEKMTNAPIKFADPEGFARADSWGPHLAAQRDDKGFVGVSGTKWPYFAEPLMSGFTAPWVKRTLDAQRSVGATVLLTPGVWADPSTPAASVATMRQHAEWARTDVGAGEHLAVNITLSPAWLTAPALRDRLFNEVLDMDETVFYIRVRWPLLPQPYGNLLDHEILAGYRALAEVFEENDKVLILPNTGSTGWLSLAWGAHGFSSGIGPGERAFADTRVIKIKQTAPRPEPTRRHFAEPILHVTDIGTSNQLDAIVPRQCTCVFCKGQRRLSSGQWDKALAGAHYLRMLADITAEIATNTRGRRVAVSRVVRRAEDYLAASKGIIPLLKGNEPRHLPVWRSAL
jgi:hypothetical protein